MARGERGASEGSPGGGAASRRAPGFWQRRYVLKHYRRLSDTELAAGSGMPVSAVQTLLQFHGATRSAGDERRIASREPVAPPWMFTPGRVREALTRSSSRPLTTTDAVLLGVMLVGSLVLYGVTAARTVAGENARELVAAARTLDVPHRSDYSRITAPDTRGTTWRKAGNENTNRVTLYTGTRTPISHKCKAQSGM